MSLKQVGQITLARNSTSKMASPIDRPCQEIETWVLALAHYENSEYEEALKVFDKIADTSKILFNCGVIHATLGSHTEAVCQTSRRWMATLNIG
jgi:hypothetical protein